MQLPKITRDDCRDYAIDASAADEPGMSPVIRNSRAPIQLREASGSRLLYIRQASDPRCNFDHTQEASLKVVPESQCPSTVICHVAPDTAYEELDT